MEVFIEFFKDLLVTLLGPIIGITSVLIILIIGYLNDNGRNLFLRYMHRLYARKRALKIIKIVKKYSHYPKDLTEIFLLEKNPKYESYKATIISELQWIPYVSALISIHYIAGFNAASYTLSSLFDILLETKVGNRDLEPEFLNKLRYTFGSYLIRYRKSIIYQLTPENNAHVYFLNEYITRLIDQKPLDIDLAYGERTKNSDLIRDFISQVIYNCANEGIFFFTDPKQDYLMNKYNVNEFKDRKKEYCNDLELAIRDQLGFYFRGFNRSFQNIWRSSLRSSLKTHDFDYYSR